jgi:starvation-inducible DNA-binding protein
LDDGIGNTFVSVGAMRGKRRIGISTCRMCVDSARYRAPFALIRAWQGDQIFAMTDDIAERVRRLGGATIRSIGHIARLKGVADNDADFVEPLDMLGELREDNQAMITRMTEIHNLCDQANDVTTASLLETWIDETQCRVWFLFEVSRTGLAFR